MEPSWLPLERTVVMPGSVEEIYVAPEGNVDMRRVPEVRALVGGGLEGDRYCKGTGYWTQYGDVCEVTLIEGEDLDEIRDEEGLAVQNGEHRRNLITRGVRLEDLKGTRFRIGEAVLEYDRPRPPCRHVQELTEPGMTRALRRRGGICARVVEGGAIRAEDPIEVL
ncbi:MOSC domain-containing protein [Rubrobacter marinus]|uniref:MOSC domain-containing protein n=2 Tax=Rubrobacter marinus TaxID=2653852 RepID=A0A6G8PVH0_9ACTN|nr:MOSC domain-containing protein [Rubrobacter marinus]